MIASYCLIPGLNFGDHPAEYLQAEAEQLGVEGMRQAVSDALLTQFQNIAQRLKVRSKDQIMSNIIDTNGKESLEGKKAGPQCQVLDSTCGFYLSVAGSSVENGGYGLWVSGNAPVGGIVALYPGVAYPVQFHRRIPGYPSIALSNRHLISRYDKVIVDAKPWGKRNIEISFKAESPSNRAEEAIFQLQQNNPLAVAQWCNHPPPGISPNVVTATLDWVPEYSKGSLLQTREYFPVIQYGPSHEQIEGSVQPAVITHDSVVSGLALIAIRDIEDEEVFLNYRLNPNAISSLPDWYHPVDKEEDIRRWS